ncbi:hypothetical protein ACTXP8_27650, partial [Klebsiella pneumoniae]|uniref:hypothetical protein n=1 Tax=Klebsiella pneumoniae TaxID=573 RepID=UPI003FD4D3DC
MNWFKLRTLCILQGNDYVAIFEPMFTRPGRHQEAAKIGRNWTIIGRKGKPGIYMPGKLLSKRCYPAHLHKPFG